MNGLIICNIVRILMGLPFALKQGIKIIKIYGAQAAPPTLMFTEWTPLGFSGENEEEHQIICKGGKSFQVIHSCHD